MELKEIYIVGDNHTVGEARRWGINLAGYETYGTWRGLELHPGDVLVKFPNRSIVGFTKEQWEYASK